MKPGYRLTLRFILLLALAACDKGSFSAPNKRVASDPGGADGSGETNAPGESEAFDGAEAASDLASPGGIPGGHFDLDTSISTYPFSMGSTEHHVHEYDDKFNSAGVDFFNILDDKFVDIKEGIPATNRPFILIVGNASLSPGGTLQINGKSYGVTQWANMTAKGQTPIFVLGAPSGDQTRLTSFKISFDKAKPIEGQLIATQTKNVVANDPGPSGEYRNGALTIQALDADKREIDPQLGVAPIGSAGMFWEATLFWHFP